MTRKCGKELNDFSDSKVCLEYRIDDILFNNVRIN